MRDKLVELLKSATSKAHWNPGDTPFMSKVADYLLSHGVTLAKDNNVLGKTPLTIAESADLERIRISIKQKFFDMAQPGMWERCTRHMECGEVRELAQYYRDMGLVYKLITGYELPWPPKEVE